MDEGGTNVRTHSTIRSSLRPYLERRSAGSGRDGRSDRKAVTCDTREPGQRREELKATLRNIIHAATGTSTISLGSGTSTWARAYRDRIMAMIVADAHTLLQASGQATGSASRVSSTR